MKDSQEGTGLRDFGSPEAAEDGRQVAAPTGWFAGGADGNCK